MIDFTKKKLTFPFSARVSPFIFLRKIDASHDESEIREYLLESLTLGIRP